MAEIDLNNGWTQDRFNGVWFDYENVNNGEYIPKTTYLLVHHFDGNNGNRLFQSFKGVHAEEKFLQEEYVAEDERVTLDMYITLAPCGTRSPNPRNCAQNLREFAGNKFKLNIKAAAPYYGNETELRELMASDNCTVEAFRKQNYIDLAKYLKFPLTVDWEPTLAMTERDEQTRQTLQRIQQGR